MTNVDFYILDSADDQARLHLACRLVEKAYDQGHQVFVHCANQDLAEQFDTLLWNFKDSAFIPHSNLHQQQDANVQVLIGAEPPHHSHDLMINIDKTVPGFVGRFSRVLEVVCQHPDWVDAGRNNFRHYRDVGYPLKHHKLAG